MPVIKHNDTDFDSLNKLMAERTRLMEIRDKKVSGERAIENLNIYNQTLPAQYRDITLSNFATPLYIKLVAQLKAGKFSSNRITVSGDYLVGKHAFTYALMKRAILQGMVTPNEIREISLHDASEAMNGGFKKQDARDKYFDNNAKIFIINGASRAFIELGIRGVNRFLAEFAQFAREQNKIVILQYETNERESAMSRAGTPWKPYLSTDNAIIKTLFAGDALLINIFKEDRRTPKKEK